MHAMAETTIYDFEALSIDGQRVAVIGIFTAVVIFIAIIMVQVLFYRTQHAPVTVKEAAG